MSPADYLKMPYGRVVVPEADGTFRGEIIEFPGCIATGDTAAEALANLEDVAASWLEATLAKGQRVPEPIENEGFSGKLVVRMAKTLHRKAAHVAAREGVSLNQFIVSSVAEQVGVCMSYSPRLWSSSGSFVRHTGVFEAYTIAAPQVQGVTQGWLSTPRSRFFELCPDNIQLIDSSLLEKPERTHAGS